MIFKKFCSVKLLDFAEALLLIKERGYLQNKVDKPTKKKSPLSQGKTRGKRALMNIHIGCNRKQLLINNTRQPCNQCREYHDQGNGNRLAANILNHAPIDI